MSTSSIPFTRDAHHLRDGCHAWLVPDGGWGLSNAGLVVGQGESLLVDTLVDLPGTAAMLSGFEALTDASPIRTIFNTHGNGDHWFGNQLVPGAEIIASEVAAEEMTADSPSAVDAWAKYPGAAGAFARHILEPFDFSGIEPTPPTRTFDDELTLDVGGVEVRLRKLGPAHSPGDSYALVPESRVLYAGDLLFAGGTPITWAGPLSHWIEGCQHMLELDVDIVVPGHGPVTDKRGIADMMAYLQFVEREARSRWEAGMAPLDAAADIDLGEYARLPHHGRLVVNVAAVYRELDPQRPAVPIEELWAGMATMEGWSAETAEA